MSDYDPELHKVDAEKWEEDKNKRGGRVTIDRWQKDGKNYVWLTYWAHKGKRLKDEYRVRVVAPTLEEAIYQAELKEVAMVMNNLLGGIQ